MTRPLDLVLSRLKNPKQVGPTQYEAPCPAHEDSRPSLAIGLGGEEQVLLKCHAGCELDAVLRELELGAKDLWPAEGQPQQARRIVATYPYRDEKGELLFEALRYEPKEFRQRRPDGAGGWVWSVKDTRRVPYRLPELLAACAAGREVFVVEGEKDVHALVERGMVATTNAGGAGKWRKEFGEFFRGASVVHVLPDADEAGEKHGAAVLASVRPVVPNAHLVRLPGAKDAAEWFSRGGTVDELHRLCGEASSTPAPAAASESFFESGAAFLERARQAPDISWLIPDLVPDIGSVLIIGEPNAGKSWLAFLACATASREGRDVFIVEEEGLIRRVGWRLEVLGVEPSRLHVAHLRQFLIDDHEKRCRVFAELQAYGRPVVMFDPLTSIHQGDENSTKDANTIRRYLDELTATVPGALVLICHHANKSSGRGEGSDIYAARGSGIFSGWANTQLNVTHIPTSKESKDVSFRVLAAKARDGHRGTKREVTINYETREVRVDEPGETQERRQAGEDVIDQAIRAALTKTIAGLSMKALTEAAKKKSALVAARVDNGLAEGWLDERPGPRGARIIRLKSNPSPDEVPSEGPDLFPNAGAGPPS